jgi:glycosyltransferase involved in cell wall biosynthesis
MKQTICLISSAQPSANPRMLKEAKALFNSGYKVNVIWCPLSPWADAFDQKLFNEFPTIKWIKAGYHAKEEPLGYFFARVRQKIWQHIYKLIGNYFDAAIKSLVLYSQELNSIACQNKADLYIGHNLGALAATVKATKKHNAKSIFDFEDFHRGETSEGSIQVTMVKEIENLYIPLVDFITTASFGITEQYQNIFSNKKTTTINNCFPLSYGIESLQKLPNRPLKLFWFSQFIGKERGLETVIESMSNFSNDEITFTLLGNVSNEIKLYFQSLLEKYNLSKKQLVFLGPVAEDEIVLIASQHHIGLASEYSHNKNRNLCLTNKVFLYLLAGEALVLSDTYAQRTFLNENPDIGLLYKQNSVVELTSVLKSYLRDSQLLLTHRQNAIKLAKTKYNWDIEKRQFLGNIESLL